MARPTEVITEPEQATVEWLTAVLRDGGHLTRGHVVGVTHTTHNAAGMSVVCLLEVRYSADTPPAERHSLLLKLARPDRDAAADGFAGLSMAQHYEKEVRFYTEMALEMPEVPTIRCYDAVYDPTTGKGHLLLEDISRTHYLPPRRYPPPEPVCEQAIDILARLHAHWWKDPRLGTEIGRFPDYTTPGGWVTRATRAVTSFLAFLGAHLPTERQRLYGRLLACLPTYARRRGQGPPTLVHQDAHWRNFLYPHEPGSDTARLFDWQSWNAGVPASDLAYMIALHWSPEPQRELMERLVRRYHDGLLQFGVTGYDWRQCWNEYRLAVVGAPFGTASAWANWGSPDDSVSTWLPRVERAFVLFDALRCEELLEA
ncbi:MAG: aminoglycoside phosphotransferase family protein [Chloroflexota bacterium]